MTADDSTKCRCANSGMTGQVGGFQNPEVCLQAFPSSLPHSLPALLPATFFALSLTLVPRSLFLNRTETLATQATGYKTATFYSVVTSPPHDIGVPPRIRALPCNKPSVQRWCCYCRKSEGQLARLNFCQGTCVNPPNYRWLNTLVEQLSHLEHSLKHPCR